MLDYDDIIEQYKAIAEKDGLEAAEVYLNKTFDDTAIAEEVSKEIEVYLMRQIEASTEELLGTPVSDEQSEKIQENAPDAVETVEG